MAKKLTNREAVVLWLQEAGFEQVVSTSRKYLKLVKGEQTVWVGKAGAIRKGPSISKSYSATDRFLPIARGWAEYAGYTLRS